jgi:hypothetical protein
MLRFCFPCKAINRKNKEEHMITYALRSIWPLIYVVLLLRVTNYAADWKGTQLT